MHDLPRQLSEDELAELFEGHTRVVMQLARLEDPLGQARKVLADAPEEEQVEALGTHPRIGQRVNVSERSAREQGLDRQCGRHLGTTPHDASIGTWLAVMAIRTVDRRRYRHCGRRLRRRSTKLVDHARKLRARDRATS